VPFLWHVRLVFSELLDPSVEDLRTEDRDGDGKPDQTQAGDPVYYGHIDTTKPVILKCGGVDVAYDGFYDPAGNDLSYPPGPGLVVQPTDFVATGTTDCSIELNDVAKDKDGNPVAAGADGGKGPYTFGVATLAVAGTAPADTETGVDPGLPIDIQFNAPVDVATIGGKVELTTAAGATVAASIAVSDADPTIVEITPDANLAENADYVVTISTGIADILGGVAIEDAWRFGVCTATSDGSSCSFGFTTGDIMPDAGA
jgi:hypothetical protein